MVRFEGAVWRGKGLPGCTRVSGLCTAPIGRSGGMVDAAVSKTVGGYSPCRFESGLRHQLNRIVDWLLGYPGSLRRCGTGP